MAAQIAQQNEEALEKLVLTTVITNGEAVSGQSTYKTANLYQDIALAREKLTDTAGTRLRPTHFFSTSDLYSYATRPVDATTERPVVTSQFAPGLPLTNGGDEKPRPAWSRFTGTVLPGGVLWFLSDAIPAVGTTNHTQLLVSAPDEAVVLAETTPLLTVYPETKANTLQVIVNLRQYACAITRHKAGTAIISSAAYTTALV